MNALRKIRLEAGFTVEKLSELAGVSPSIIIKRERLKYGSVRLDTARRLANALSVTVDQIFPEAK